MLTIANIGHSHFGGQIATGTTGGASLEAPVDNSAASAARSGSGVPAAQPGPPVARLALDSQTIAQNASDKSDTSARSKDAAAAPSDENAQGEKVNAQGLTEAEQREVERLKQRDREVREHERAHATVGGSIAGSPTYTYQKGPDGKQYAVGGEVSIDTSPVAGNPQATIRKMEQVKRAALAPSNPSSQDRRVASQADAAIIKAKQELAEERREEQAERQSSDTTGTGNSIGGQDPLFDPGKRFQQQLSGSIGSPLGTGLAGSGELKTNVGLTSPGDLFNMVA